jgi:hypothetical protein
MGFIIFLKGFNFFNLYSGGWSPIWVHSALRPPMTYCASPGWLWWRRNWWNDWQGKPKYSEETFPSAALSTTNLISCPDANPGPRRRRQRLTAWATTRQCSWGCLGGENLQGATASIVLIERDVTCRIKTSAQMLGREKLVLGQNICCEHAMRTCQNIRTTIVLTQGNILHISVSLTLYPAMVVQRIISLWWNLYHYLL